MLSRKLNIFLSVFLTRYRRGACVSKEENVYFELDFDSPIAVSITNSYIQLMNSNSFQTIQ